MEALVKSIDLERSELRYIFYTFDQESLIDDFRKLGFTVLVYTDTPITRTLYFGSRMGLKPGISIKARSYTAQMLGTIWKLDGKTKFNFLEIKASADKNDGSLHGFLNNGTGERLGWENNPESANPRQVFVHVQRAAEGGVLKDFTFKSKNRIQEPTPFLEQQVEPVTKGITLHDIITLLCETSDLDENLSPHLRDVLNDKIRPILFDTLDPAVATQYARIHLVPEGDTISPKIRITIDPGVQYYDPFFEDQDAFIDNNNIIAEYMTREQFSRLEFKVDPVFHKEKKEMNEAITNILVKYGALATVSKKWTGITLAGERFIQKQDIWKEPLKAEYSGFFPVHQSWFSYGNMPEVFVNFIKKSKRYQPYSINPRIIVKNETIVTGTVATPYPSLVVAVEGPKITYSVPPKSYPVVRRGEKPDFFITKRPSQPVRTVFVSSKSDLDKALHPGINIQGNIYYRSYGLLVVNKNNNKVFKLTIERKVEDKESTEETVFYCKLRYIGTRAQLAETSEQDIFDEMLLFYKEFSPDLALDVDYFLSKHGFEMKPSA
nr:hypothetical protein [Candidatus Sigynarchaeota archaeon]